MTNTENPRPFMVGDIVEPLPGFSCGPRGRVVSVYGDTLDVQRFGAMIFCEYVLAADMRLVCPAENEIDRHAEQIKGEDA